MNRTAPNSCYPKAHVLVVQPGEVVERPPPWSIMAAPRPSPGGAPLARVETVCVGKSGIGGLRGNGLSPLLDLGDLLCFEASQHLRLPHVLYRRGH